MSKLTKEDVTNEILERVEFVTGFGSDGWGDADPREIIAASVNAARELLSLRTAGDEEVDSKVLEISHWIDNEAKCPMEREACNSAVRDLQDLRDIAIVRGQQLREAREENENLKLERDGAVACMDSRLQQIYTLTAERDDLKQGVDFLRQEIEDWKETNRRAEAERHASREEVVGLLDHILSCIITVRQENTPEWMEYIVEEVNKVNKAMGDSDRVELSRGDIVIVKGGSEIVEGNHA